MVQKIVLILVFLMVGSARAQLISFETTPAGGAPVDNQPNSAPYALAGGGTVSMFFDTNANYAFDGNDVYSLFEATGQDGTDGFANGTSGINDDPAPGYAAQLGSWFVRQPVSGSIPPPFLIDYTTSQTITALSGEIWDIDGSVAGTEQWRIDVLDSANAILATQFSPIGTSAALDSQPWVFTFAGLPTGVDKLLITFTGTKTNGLGLAFNNFQPTTPEPTAAAAIATAGVVLLRRKRR